MILLSNYNPRVSAYDEFSCFQKKDYSYPWDPRYRSRAVVDPQRRIDWEPTIEDAKNSYGCIRWRKLRALYFSGLVDLPFCVTGYREWRDDREDLWLDAVDAADNVLGSVFVVAAKRGNEWYKERLAKKFSFFEDLPPIYFFNDWWGLKSTPMLFCTFTVDPALVNHDLDLAWDSSGYERHLFETKLRQEYGRFVKLAAWESHESGYPHMHVVYFFLEYRFQVWEHFDKKNNKFTGNRTWRVSDHVRDKIRGFWGLGSNIDIQGVQDTLGALREVSKYVTKTIWNVKGDLTNTLCSLHNKKIYTLSQCDYVKKRDNDPVLPTLKTVEEKAQYLNKQVDKWAKRDFIGAVWGVSAYMDFYKKLHEKGFNEGMAEPGLSALVKEPLHNCNIDLSRFDRFVFRGSFRHDDLRLFLDLSDDHTNFKEPPPEDVRLFFGVDRICLSGGSSRRRNFFSEEEDDF